MDTKIESKINAWLNGNIDQDVKNEIRRLKDESETELADAFYKNLEFGTGGLRGLMGVGTNRMNKYTVGMATQGYANYLRYCFGENVKVAIAHDSRNNSRFFAETAAKVFAELGCQGGVVCTASHNPKEYNGYKAYWDDGSQLVPPHDKNVILEVDKILSVDEVKWSGGEENIVSIGSEIDQKYIAMVKGLSVYPEIIEKHQQLKIVYTPIHGTGIRLVPPVLKEFGFKNVHIVEEQQIPDGNFPTVVYPNPEESEMPTGLL
jgi:phosphoglucomutase